MIFDSTQLTGDMVIDTDVCVVGSGAGGSALAWMLSQQGREITIVEAGSAFTPRQFTQREDDMFPKLFYEGGGRRTSDHSIRILHGHGVGGSTVHNLNLCKRIPAEIVTDWSLQGLSFDVLNGYMDIIEKKLGVQTIEAPQMNRNNQMLQKGVTALGYRGQFLRHNREGCQGSGYCELGCAFDAKMNAMRVFIPEIVARGGQVFSQTRAVLFQMEGRKVTSLKTEVRAPGTDQVVGHVTIHAKTFVCAGGAIETPLLLFRSHVPDPKKLIGSRLHLHPGVAVAGLFETPILSWKGIPQSFECTEFQNEGIWIIPASAHPAGAASLLPGFAGEHESLMAHYAQMAPLTAMIHDSSYGTVSLRGQFGAHIDYKLMVTEREKLVKGIKECAKILLAAGATAVIIPTTRPIDIRDSQDLDNLQLHLRDGEMDIVSVHPMSTVWMGQSWENSCTDPTGKYHHLDNLYISDTSLFPTSIGAPPQIATYSIGLHVANSILA